MVYFSGQTHEVSICHPRDLVPRGPKDEVGRRKSSPIIALRSLPSTPLGGGNDKHTSAQSVGELNPKRN